MYVDARTQNALTECFRSLPVDAVYVFGSVARGTDTPQSDLDIGVLFHELPEQTLEARPFRLEAELSEKLGRQVQIIVMNDAPPDLVHRILRDGQIILEQDRSARIAFEIRSRNDYWDILPVLKEYRRPRR